MRISDWSSDVCSSDLACTIAGDICFRARSEPWRSHSSSQPLDLLRRLVDQRDDVVQCRLVQVALAQPVHQHGLQIAHRAADRGAVGALALLADVGQARDQPIGALTVRLQRSEEHTSELQSLMRISYAVFCLKK